MSLYNVFISHKSSDKEQLKKIENFLTENNISWWSDSKLQPGLDWTKQIEDGIKNSTIMLVLLSQNVINDPDNMESEITLATRYRLKYVVVKLDDSLVEDYTGVFSLYLGKVQWLNASPNLDQVKDSLLLSIKMNLAETNNKKSELNEQLNIKLKRLARKQQAELEKKSQAQFLENIIDYNVAKVEAMIDDKKYTNALSEINNLLKVTYSWKYLKLKLLCITQNFTINKDRIPDLLYAIKKTNISEEDYNQLLLELKEKLWQKLNSYQQSSNIASAINIFTKLNLLGLDITDNNKCGLSELEYLNIYDENKLLEKNVLTYYNRTKPSISKRDALAFMEHLRWNAFMLVNGYIPMPKSMIKVYKENDKLIIYKNDVNLRLHACITTNKGLEEYFDYLAKLIVKETNISYEESFNMVENKKYDYMLMDTVYTDLALLGVNIISIKKGAVKKII